MKPQRARAPARSRSAAAPGGKSAGSFRRLARYGLGAALCALVVAAWIGARSSLRPRLPSIPYEALDARSAAVLRRQADQVKAMPASGKAWGQLGGLLRSLEFLPQARVCLAEAERLEPQEPRWPYLLGLTWQVESPPRTIAELRKAVAAGGMQPDAVRLRLAKLLAETGAWEEAEQILRPLLEAEPAQGPALLLLAHAAQARGRLPEAAALASRSTADPRSARGAWALLASVNERLGDTAAARTAAARAAAAPATPIPPDPFESEILVLREDPRQLSDRAQQLLSARRLREARSILQQLVRDHQDFAEGWLLLGRQQLLEGQWDGAIASIRRHLQLDPGSASGYFQLGMAQLNAQRYVEAAASFQNATQLKHDYGPAYFNLGFALGKTGAQLEAIAALREAIRLSPEHFDSYLLLADLLSQLGQRDESVDAMRAAELLQPNDSRLATLRIKLARRAARPP